MGGETPLEYSEMESSHFKKLVHEFPFLTGVLALCFESWNPQVHRLNVSRVGPELLKSDRDYGFPISESGCNCSENYSCVQLFAVKSGIVGELQIVDPMDYVDIGLGQFWYDPLYSEPDDDWGDFDHYFDDEGPEYESWPVLGALKGDEEYLIQVQYWRREEEEEDYDFVPHGTGQFFYHRAIEIYKPPKHSTPTENINRWQALRRDEATRAYNRWHAHQQERPSPLSLN